MTTEILWCRNHGASIVPQTMRCGKWFSLPGGSKRRNSEICPVVPMLLVRKDAPSVLLDEAITAENWVTARATRVRFAPDSMTLPPGRYIRVDQEVGMTPL